MYRMSSPLDAKQAAHDKLRAKLRIVDIRLARMSVQNAGSVDLLARRLFEHSVAERATIVAQLLASTN